ncbi:MAG: response regulator [Deferribacteres bacterium]|nr:response regulator [Deferribacteres bacterium]
MNTRHIWNYTRSNFSKRHDLKRRFLHIILLLSIPVIIHAQVKDIKFDQFSVKDGLSFGGVKHIIQDDDGFLWLGTNYGLNRFDGCEFKHYLNNPADSSSISDNQIYCLYIDKRGILWVGTRNGLNKYNKYFDRFTRYLNEPGNTNSLLAADIQYIFQDKSGAYWIGGSKGVSKTDRTFTRFNHFTTSSPDPNGLPSGQLGTMYLDSYDHLWITIHGNDRETLSCLNVSDEKFTHFTHIPNDSTSISDGLLYPIYEDKNRNLWVGADELNLLDRKKNTFTRFKLDVSNAIGMVSANLKAIYEDNAGNFWIAIKEYLYTFDRTTQKLTKVTRDTINALSIYEDRSGVIWITGQGQLLLKYDQENKQFPPPVFHKSAGQAIEDEYGTIWIASDLGLYRIDRNSGHKSLFQINPDGNGNFISTILIDKTGKMWIGMNQGLYHFDRSSHRYSKAKLKSGAAWTTLDNVIVVLREDSLGMIWIGSKDGLYKFDRITETTKHYQHNPNDSRSLHHNFIRNILLDRQGSVWICATDLHKYDPKHDNFTHEIANIDDPAGPGHNQVLWIHESNNGQQGTYWIGTDIGLFKYDRASKKFSHFTEEDGLPHVLVRGIQEDNHNNLWILTGYGLSKFNPIANSFKNYDVDDGLPTGQYWELIQNKTGKMFVGGNNGLSIFHPDSIQDDPHGPPIVLTRFKISNKDVEFDSSLSHLNQIILNYDENMIAFEFAALDFTNPQKNQFAFKMEGFNKEWIHAGNKNEATYTNVPPGKYTFRVKGSNHDGVWNEKGTSIQIIILPPWWKTMPAYIAYFLLFALLFYTIRRTQLNRITIKHELELKSLHSEKLEEIDRAKSRFFANISHEFRTPLTLILGSIETWRTKALPDWMKKDVQVLERNGRRLLRLINQLLDISKLESGRMSLQARPESINKLLKYLVYSFHSLSERKHIDLHFQTSVQENGGTAPELIVYIDRDKFDKIITNLLSNAFKLTPDGGNISVEVSTHFNSDLQPTDTSRTERRIANDFVEIAVSDTGPGIPQQHLDKIFDRFYQVDSSTTRTHQGCGIGLALTKELVELHHGQIFIESEIGKGTRFIVKLPLGNNHLQPHEIIDDKPGANQVGDESSVIAEALQDIANQTEKSTPILDDAVSENATIVLVVEDNADVRTYIRERLKNSYQIIEAVDGAQGIEKAQSLIPDLVISDLMMPEKDGYELCYILKNDEKTGHIPIILLTAKASDESKIAGLETGADDYVVKPFNEKELQTRVKNLIEQRRKLRERFSRNITLQPKEIAITTADERFIERLMKVVEENISDEHFSVEELAQNVGLGRVQLHRKLRALTNQAPSDFIRSMRLKKAAQLLAKNDGNIAEIAYKVGFNNPSYFAECFRKQFDILPSQ